MVMALNMPRLLRERKEKILINIVRACSRELQQIHRQKLHFKTCK